MTGAILTRCMSITEGTFVWGARLPTLCGRGKTMKDDGGRRWTTKDDEGRRWTTKDDKDEHDEGCAILIFNFL